jgi:EpsI family protein
MTQASAARVRFLLVAVLLSLAALFLYSRSHAEHLPARDPLSSFPTQVGDWSGRDVSIQPEIREILGAGEFLLRIYSRDPQEPYIDLFLAYFPTQRTRSTIHSPQNCLPGAGWVPIESSHLQMSDRGGGAITINRYVIAKGLERRLVLYWYQAHGRVVASEYWGKFYLVADAIRMNRTDGALVRIITAVDHNEAPEHAQRRAIEFAQAILPALDNYVPK